MKKILFKEIKINNFLSVGKNTLKLNYTDGITLITGENRDKGGRNGVGKSTLIESLYWCLFGGTIRDIKKDKIVHNLTGKDCVVTLLFDVIKNEKVDSYILSRYAEPNKIELWCNGVEVTRSSMPKTDEYIKEIIGATEEVFQNAVIMTANNTLPFMAQKKVDKRKFIEGVLQLGVFGEMLLQVRADLNECKRENETLASAFSEKQKTLQIYQKQFDKQEENKKLKIISLREKLNNNIEKIKEISSLSSLDLEQKSKDLQTLIKKKEVKIKSLEKMSEECKDIYSSLQKKELEIKFNLDQLKKEKLNFLNKTKTCPSCKRPYEDHDLEQIDSLIEGLDLKIKELEVSNKENNCSIKSQQQNCDKITKAIGILLLEIKNHQEEIHKTSLVFKEVTHLSDNNLELETEIKKTEEYKNDFLDLIETQKADIKVQEELLDNVHKKISILESSKHIVSEEGVKTYIIKKMLPILNSKLNFYLQALEAPCKCEFNEMFEETIYNERGIECSYFNFSGGESKRIDLAILFMFQDILRMQTGTSFSLSMYDELFDSALDEKGVDKILTILRDRVEQHKENIYIVSHNKAAERAGIDQVLFLEKQDGVTRFIEQI
jgi:DNA repair exonuclease SbcCD ATPase subunit